MRKAAIFAVMILAAVAMSAAVAYACDQKGTTSKNTASKVETKASFANSGDKVCPASAAYVCDSQKGTSETAMAAGADKTDSKWSTVTFAVQGMTCTGCERSLSTALAEADGVKKVVKVCHKSEQAVVKVDPNEISDADLAKLITSHGYQAEIVPAVAKSADVSSEAEYHSADGKAACGADRVKTESAKSASATK